jgi:hypothetical protein
MIKFFFVLMIIILSSCVGSPKPQDLPAGHYVGTATKSIYNQSKDENIVMNFKMDASSSVNGQIIIYDTDNQDTSVLTIDMIRNGTWNTIINGQNGLDKPCFTGVVYLAPGQTYKGYPIAFVNCWLQENFIPGSWTFQAQYLIWNPLSTIQYAEFGGTVFLHTKS